MKNISFAGKKALVRVDFNVPLDKATKAVTDDTRIRAAIPTIKYILENGGSAILMSHFDRPLKKLKEDGSIDVDAFTLRRVLPTLSELLGKPVHFCEETVGDKVTAACKGAVNHCLCGFVYGHINFLEYAGQVYVFGIGVG